MEKIPLTPEFIIEALEDKNGPANPLMVDMAHNINYNEAIDLAHHLNKLDEQKPGWTQDDDTFGYFEFHTKDIITTAEYLSEATEETRYSDDMVAKIVNNLQIILTQIFPDRYIIPEQTQKIYNPPKKQPKIKILEHPLKELIGQKGETYNGDNGTIIDVQPLDNWDLMKKHDNAGWLSPAEFDTYELDEYTILVAIDIENDGIEVFVLGYNGFSLNDEAMMKKHLELN